ncbi:MAG: hypothetical protein Q4D79_00040 [Propionibacteriaceae bacterium]|nr:hypothetical protein [Propionibacteriaceae bacterium]
MTPEQLQQLIAEHVRLTGEIAALTSRLDEVTEQLRTLPEGKYPTSVGVVTVSAPAKRFDPKLANEILPPALLDACAEKVVTASKAKQVLPPALYAQCTAAAASARPSVRVKAA